MTRDSAFRSSPHAASPRSGNAARTHARERLPRSERSRSDAPPKPAPSEVPTPSAEHLPPRRSHAQFDEPALFYDPPYESLLADRLARRLVRHLKPSCGLRHETIALTPRDCFRLDFVIDAGDDVRGLDRAGIVIGERPEAEGAPDLYDALVVGSGAVDVLFHLDPEGLDAHLTDALFLMCDYAPALFEHPERVRAEASRGAFSGTFHGPDVRFSYPMPPVDVETGRVPERPVTPPDLVVRRLSGDAPAAWAADYRRALTHFRVPESQHRPPAVLRRAA